jgi:hypothetical protein
MRRQTLEACAVASAVALGIVLEGGGRVLADPVPVDTPVQRFVIPPRTGSPAMRIVLANQERILASWTAHGVAVIEGPSHAKTWPFGASGRVLLIATTDDRGQRATRVLAVEDGCYWHEPEVPLEEVQPGLATFTFTRAVSTGQQVVPLRWEASSTGVRVQHGLAGDWYRARVRDARQELDQILGRGADCTREPRRDGLRAVELATDIYVWSVAARSDETQARARLGADLAATPDCSLAFVSSPGWRADAQSGAVAFARRLSDGRFDTGQDANAGACDEVPVTVEITPTRMAPTVRSAPSARSVARTDLGY